MVGQSITVIFALVAIADCSLMLLPICLVFGDPSIKRLKDHIDLKLSNVIYHQFFLCKRLPDSQLYFERGCFFTVITETGKPFQLI